MHNVAYTNSRCLTKTQTDFGPFFLHLQEVPSQLSRLQHVKWFQTSVRPCAAEMQFSVTIHDFLKLCGGHDTQFLKIRGGHDTRIF